MNEIEEKVLKTITEAPGLRTVEIASRSGISTNHANEILYGSLKKDVVQKNDYRWYPVNAKGSAAVREEKSSVKPDSLLSSLCNYYLNCLSLEQNDGITALLVDSENLRYAPLPSLDPDSSDPVIAKLIRSVSSERTLTAHVGYPVIIEKRYTSGNGTRYHVAPVFLYPVEINAGHVHVSEYPAINMEAIRRYSTRDVNSQVYDLIALENELGLGAADIHIDPEELVARLQAIRQWDWKDDLLPSEIAMDPPLESITQEGIYNRAVFIVSERPPYTIGLESELGRLAAMQEKDYKGTALYDWLHAAAGMSMKAGADIEDTPLLEVLPMNSEQEQAVRHALANPLTIVTGPPGTGKSQVVTNLVVNAAYTGKSILLTSRNNKAVDVVESRVNSLGKRPVMIRVGGYQYASHLAEMVAELLSETTDINDRQEYERCRDIYNRKTNEYISLKKEKEDIIALRNETDHLEQKVCQIRSRWGHLIGRLTDSDIYNCSDVMSSYCYTSEKYLRISSSLLGRIFWFLIGNRLTSEMDGALRDVANLFRKYDVPPLEAAARHLSRDTDGVIRKTGKELFDAMQTIRAYDRSRTELSSSSHLEEIDRELSRIKKELSDVAGSLWDKWLATRSYLIDAQTRREMNEYVSAMHLAQGEDISKSPALGARFNALRLKMTRYLPCWAVTSLSANNKIPFEPGYFDLVVIDESSQCDIASVLPMLFRAKGAVIIGDPKQLSHISTISKRQDLGMLEKHGVNMGWSYTATSAYGLAASLTDSGDIIQLRDHHRSYGDIIEFSNAEFYDGRLRVATNYDTLVCPPGQQPGIRWVNVTGTTKRPSEGGAVNTEEALAVLEELRDLVLPGTFTGTIGVVTPFRAQANKINELIRKDEILQQALLGNDFLADTVHKFQGDERDIMIFSPAISAGTLPGALSFLKNTGNLFNVAVTRARSSLIVVGDISYCAGSGVPYMEHFVEYVNELSEKRSKEETVSYDIPVDRHYPSVTNPEDVSDWEKLMYTALFDSGIRTVPQLPVDKYRLDLSLIKGERKLDIEVDGEMYHSDWSGELSYRDQLRNQRLNELGWEVMRFWVYDIRDDLEKCVAAVNRWYNA